jgi:hypothetical protein
MVTVSRHIRPADKDLVRWRAVAPRPPRSASGDPRDNAGPQIPALIYQVLGSATSSSIRNAWVDNPTSAPASTNCLSTLHLTFIPLTTP